MKAQRGDAATLRQFLDFLRHQGVVPAEKIPPPRLTPVEKTVLTFKRYLRDERMLAEASVIRYVPFVRKLLVDRFGDGPMRLSCLCAGDVVRFVRRQAPRLRLKRAQLLTSALRSFLRYARYLGQVRCDLAAAVPTVANWSMPSIPRAIPADAVRRLLASINRRTAMGRRDYAILLLLARLGLRAGEVVRLELEDIDWNAGSITVQGKVVDAAFSPYPRMLGPQSLRTCGADGRGAAVVTSFCGSKHPSAAFSVLRLSHTWFGRTSHVLASRRPPTARISFVMR